MEPRQQHIAHLVEEILPHLPDYEKRKKQHTLYIATLVLLCAMFTGYSFGEAIRPLSAQEYATLNAMLEFASQQRAMTTKEMTHALLQRFQVQDLTELPANQWVNALQFLTKQAG